MGSATHDRHYDPDQLADLAEDLLPDDAAAAARSHLESCAACHAEDAALGGVTAALRAVDPAPMPAEVALRLEAALARESATGASSPVAAVSPTAEPAGSEPVAARRPSRFRRAATGLLAAAAVLGGVLVVGENLDWLGGGGDDAPAAGEAADTTGRDADEGMAEEGGEDQLPGPSSVTAPELAYTSVDLTDEVQTLLTGSTPRLPSTEGSPDQAVTETNGVPDRAAAAGCVEAVAAKGGTDGVPLAVDISSYDGRPAVVVVLPPVEDGGAADIWVVGTGCLADPDSALDLLDRAPLAVDSGRR